MRQILSQYEMERLAKNYFNRGIGFAFVPIQGTDTFAMLTYECEKHPQYPQIFEVKGEHLTGNLVCLKCEAEKKKVLKVKSDVFMKRGSGVQPLLAGGP